MNIRKLLLLAVLVVLVAAFFALDLGRFFSLEYIRGAREQFATLYQAHPAQVIGAFFAIYVAVTALSLPGAAIMTLLAGAIFGLWVGTLVVSFASSLGATLAMLASRYLLRDSVKSKFGARLADIDRGVEREGAFYLFTLRLVPVFPFFVINLLMGLTAMKATTFYWVSQLGMLAGTLVYVNAGTQLAQIRSLQGILRPGLLGSFVLLGLFPLVAKKIVDVVQRAQGLCEVGRAQAAALRPQHGGHRRRRGRAGDQLHRRGGQGQGDAGRKPQDGRRLPELRLRAEQGTDQDCHAGAADAPQRRLRHRLGRVQARLRAGHGARGPRGQGGRAARFGRALHRPGRGRDRRPGDDRRPLAREDRACQRRGAGAQHAQHRHRHRCAPLRAAAAGAGRRRLPDQRHAVGPARAARAAGGAGRRADRLRAGAKLRPAGFGGDAGGDGAAHHDPRGRGRLGLCAQGARGRRRGRAHRPQGAALREGRRAEVHRRRSRRPGKAHRLRPAAVRGGPRGAAAGLRPGGTGHSGEPHRAGQRVPGNAVPQHPGRRRRGRAVPVHPHRRAPGLVCGGQRAVRQLQALQGRLLGHPLVHLHRPGGRARRPERAGGQGEGRGLRGDTLRHRRPGSRHR